MNKTALVIIGVAIVVLGVWYFMGQTQVPSVDQPQELENERVEEVVETGNIITLTESGFSPSPLTIKVGESVKFVNNSENDFWPASAMHPTHKVYPGSDIDKCDTSERDLLFDACGGIAPGGSWEFTFNEVGEWGYHNHLDAKSFGKIIVE